MNNNDQTVLVEITSTALGRDCRLSEKRLVEFQEAAQECGVEFGVQVHNTEKSSRVEFFRQSGLRMSVHAPIAGRFMLNLGSRDGVPGLDALRLNAEFMRRYGIDKAVFHGFWMLDKPIPNFGHGLKYHEIFAGQIRSDLFYNDQTVNNRNFCDEPEYLERRELVNNRLAQIRDQYPDLTFCLETDFPCFGAASMLGSELVKFGHPLCLDTSHFWVTANLFDLDFNDECAKLFASKHVAMVHLHASPFTRRISTADRWNDGHQSLATLNDMNLPQVVADGKRNGVKHWVLEIPRGTPDDLKLFAEMWHNASTEMDSTC